MQTRQNAALPDEAAAAAASLQEQAGKLAEAVSGFKLDRAAHKRSADVSDAGCGRHHLAATPFDTAIATATPKRLVAGGGDAEWDEF